MNRILILLLVLVSLTEVRAQPGSQSLLWEISGKNLTAPSYLLGSIHMICPEELIWSPSMDAALSRSRRICLELDMDDPETIRKMMQGLSSGKSEKSLRETLAAADYARLEKFAKDSAGVDISKLNGVSPEMLPLMFVSRLLPCPMPASYETKIAMQAAASRKPIEGLESIDEQLALLEKLGSDTGAGEIMKIVDSFTAMKAQFQLLVSAYRRQDLDTLARMIEASPLLGGQKDAFLSDRNRRWIPRMETFMQDGPVFFAVGAGHLPGNSGVLELLRKSGYTVRPLK